MHDAVGVFVYVCWFSLSCSVVNKLAERTVRCQVPITTFIPHGGWHWKFGTHFQQGCATNKPTRGRRSPRKAMSRWRLREIDAGCDMCRILFVPGFGNAKMLLSDFLCNLHICLKQDRCVGHSPSSPHVGANCLSWNDALCPDPEFLFLNISQDTPDHSNHIPPQQIVSSISLFLKINPL